MSSSKGSTAPALKFLPLAEQLQAAEWKAAVQKLWYRELDCARLPECGLSVYQHDGFIARVHVYALRSGSCIAAILTYGRQGDREFDFTCVYNAQSVVQYVEKFAERHGYSVDETALEDFAALLSKRLAAVQQPAARRGKA